MEQSCTATHGLQGGVWEGQSGGSRGSEAKLKPPGAASNSEMSWSKVASNTGSTGRLSLYLLHFLIGGHAPSAGEPTAHSVKVREGCLFPAAISPDLVTR